VENGSQEEGAAMSRAADHLRAKGIEFEEISHASAFTTLDEARALGIEADGVAKTLLLETATGLTIAVIGGDRRLDMHLLEQAAGDAHTRLATEEEIQRAYPDMELGCLPPLPSMLGTTGYVDPGVTAHETIVFADGTRTGSIKATTADVLSDEPVTVAPIARLGRD
jgi:prolyl-tRNA editing enzyme YbaK/EbsC (Cys-tRNA(Pro) deacylase)